MAINYDLTGFATDVYKLTNTISVDAEGIIRGVNGVVVEAVDNKLWNTGLKAADELADPANPALIEGVLVEKPSIAIGAIEVRLPRTNESITLNPGTATYSEGTGWTLANGDTFSYTATNPQDAAHFEKLLGASGGMIGALKIEKNPS